MRTNQGPVVSTMMINSVVGIGYVSVSNEAEKAEDEAKTLQIYKVGVVPLLVKAVQELSAKVEALENAQKNDIYIK